MVQVNNHSQHAADPSSSEGSGQFINFVKNCTTVVKVTAIMLILLGIGSVIAAPPLAAFSILPVGAAVAMGITRGFVACTTTLCHKVLTIASDLNII